jgi:hypothetical protein
MSAATLDSRRFVLDVEARAGSGLGQQGVGGRGGRSRVGVCRVAAAAAGLVEAGRVLAGSRAVDVGGNVQRAPAATVAALDCPSAQRACQPAWYKCHGLCALQSRPSRYERANT